jgi:small subunit ribosomal protein S10
MLMRPQITQSSRPHTQCFARSKSSKSDEDREDRDGGAKDGKVLNDLLADIENGEMPLDQRLEDMGLDPKEYKAYGEHIKEDNWSTS